MTKTTTIGLRLSPEMKKRLQELAKSDRRSLSSYIEVVLEKHLMERAK